MPYFSSLSRFLLGAALLPLLLASRPARARADAQVSVRSHFELGYRELEGEGKLVIGGGVRGDAMFGAARPRAFRIGPAFELRTLDLQTAEAALGAGVLVPLPCDCPIGLTGLVGPALRKGDLPDGLVGIGTATWGFRGYNYGSWYGYGLNLFFSGRKQLGDVELVEYTGGLEIDIVFTTVIPARAMRTFLRGGDPLAE